MTQGCNSRFPGLNSQTDLGDLVAHASCVPVRAASLPPLWRTRPPNPTGEARMLRHRPAGMRALRARSGNRELRPSLRRPRQGAPRFVRRPSLRALGLICPTRRQVIGGEDTRTPSRKENQGQDTIEIERPLHLVVSRHDGKSTFAALSPLCSSRAEQRLRASSWMKARSPAGAGGSRPGPQLRIGNRTVLPRSPYSP